MKKEKNKIEINSDFLRALHLVNETDKNVFITGRAGTGKSTLLSYFRDNTKKRVIVLAPTGVAAVNVSGQTIHSFFGFKPDITLQKVRKKFKDDDKKNIYKKIDAIIIDEISMVRADLLDCVDKFLRLNGKNKNLPFGGIQMIFIGDLYQLSPVVASKEKDIFKIHYASPYFFDAKIFANSDLALEFVELEKIYRQSDEFFINILNAIRNRSVEDKHLQSINQRFRADFEPPKGEYYINLTTTNDLADKINREKLNDLPGKIISSKARIAGNFAKEYYPTTDLLELKKGAQIMLLNNDSAGRWVNGTIAKLVDVNIDEESGSCFIIQLENGNKEEIFPYTWEIFHFALENNRLVSKAVGSFTQYPMRLAFAVTIHKSQGKTFDKVVIDIGRGTFAHGQMYVALSRCRTLEGIVLKKEFKKEHIMMDWRVVKFVTGFQYQQAEKLLPLNKKVDLIKKAIKEKKDLKITYLKGKDEKSRRIIFPKKIGKMEYAGHLYLGVVAHCRKRNEERVFNVERILELEVI